MKKISSSLGRQIVTRSLAHTIEPTANDLGLNPITEDNSLEFLVALQLQLQLQSTDTYLSSVNRESNRNGSQQRGGRIGF